MERVVRWARLIERLWPLYPKGERGGPPIGLDRMLRIYFLQQWYGLADEALEDALYDSQALHSFAGIELNCDPVPDATTVPHFRHWPEVHKLTEALLAEVAALLLRQGTIPAFARTDATIIAAPSSTKTNKRSRDPEMHQTKKGNQWYFGMKARIGADLVSGIWHHAFADPHRRQRSRYQPDGVSVARRGENGLCRCWLRWRRDAAGARGSGRVLEHRRQA